MTKLYRWQQEALDLWVGEESDRLGNKKMTVGAVTGAGKTRFALEVAEYEVLQAVSLGETIYITVVVPRKALMPQWKEAFESRFAFTNIPIGRVGGGGIKGWPSKPMSHQQININIITINAQREGKMQIAHNRHLVIVDECHNLRGAKNRNALNPDFIGEECVKVLGLSATPHPTPEAKRVVEELCGEIKYAYRYAQALEDGVIPSFVVNAVNIPMTDEETKELDDWDGKVKWALKKADSAWGAERNKMLNIAKQYGIQRKQFLNRVKSRTHMALRILNKHQGQPTMLFHDRTEDVDRLAELTPHLNPAVYHSNRPSADEEIESFITGDTDVLYSCMALTEGFNVPRVKVAVMMSGSNAPLRRIQTLGRCLRGDDDTPNEIYFLYIKGTKDEDGLRNLIREADLPTSVMRYFTMNGEWMEESSPTVVGEAPVFRERKERPQCPKCERTFRGEVGLNTHHCVPKRQGEYGSKERRQRLRDILSGKHDNMTFDEFMDL